MVYVSYILLYIHVEIFVLLSRYHQNANADVRKTMCRLNTYNIISQQFFLF